MNIFVIIAIIILFIIVPLVILFITKNNTCPPPPDCAPPPTCAPPPDCPPPDCPPPPTCPACPKSWISEDMKYTCNDDLFGIKKWYPELSDWDQYKKGFNAKTNISLEDCESECNKYPDCKSIAYYSPNKSCWLGSNSEIDEHAGAVPKFTSCFKKQ